MTRSAPPRRLAAPLAGAISAWAAVRRHRRLNFAVVGCLLVMFGLVVSLIVAVRVIDAKSKETLGASIEWAQTSQSLTATAGAVRTHNSGDDEAVAHLALLRNSLSPVLEGLGEAFEAEAEELAFVLTQVTHLVDGEGQVVAAAMSLRTLGERIDALADVFLTQSETETIASLNDLDRWFGWMQIVAIVAAAIFALVVATVILPLSRSIERSLAKLQTWRERSTRDATRRTLAAQVSDGLDIAETEPATYPVIERALRVAAADHTAELLLADSSNAHMRAAVLHPENGGAGCSVVSPWSCPAVRRGSTMVFDDSKSIRSCPHLADHETPCSAVCSPLTFMGQPMGVLHATGPVGETPAKDLVEDLALIAGEAATRIGTLRAFAKAELQASTDVLTGLPNRRATNERLRALVSAVDGGAMALIEVEGLITLNERQGKQTGDRALKAAAESLQFSCREGDFVGRWAGAEFVAVFPGRSVGEARDLVSRMHDDLSTSLARADLQGLVVQFGVADTRLANTARGILQIANDALTEAREAGAWSQIDAAKVALLPRRNAPDS